MKLKAFLADTFQPNKGSIKIERKLAIEEYREKYQRLVGDDPTRLFRHEVYVVTPVEAPTILVKTPSNSLPGFQYDVLLQFIPTNNAVTFEDCDIKVFSNSPGFVFTYAYTFAHWDPTADNRDKVNRMTVATIRNSLPPNRVLIPGTENKLGKTAMTRPAYYRNPMGIPQFDESIYFAIFYVIDNVDFASVVGCTNKLSLNALLRRVSSFDHIQAERKKAEVKYKQSKASDRADTKKVFEVKEKEIQVQSGVKTLQKPKQPKSPMAAKKMSTGATRSPMKPKSTRSSR